MKPESIFFMALKQGIGELFVINEGKGNLQNARRFFAYYQKNEIAELSSLLKIELETIPNCKIYGSTTNSSQSDIFSFSIDIHPHDIAQFLGERQVCVRA